MKLVCIDSKKKICNYATQDAPHNVPRQHYDPGLYLQPHQTCPAAERRICKPKPIMTPLCTLLDPPNVRMPHIFVSHRVVCRLHSSGYIRVVAEPYESSAYT
jgi:hypothetical protein